MEFIDRNQYRNLSGIYQIKNKQTGAVYIGQTKQRFIKRFYHHVWKLKDGTHDNSWLQRSFDKHGEDAFVFQILKVEQDFNKLDEQEMFYISKARENGVCYNLTDGGDGAKGVPMRPQHLKYLSQLNRKLNTGKKASDQTKRKMSEARKGMKRKSEDIAKMIQTRQEQYLSGGKTKLNKITADVAREIKVRLMNGQKYKVLADEYGISTSSINAIRSDRAWKFVEVDGWDDYIKIHHSRNWK